MRLLVSVSNETEATSGLAGGADIVDAKDPTRGALGAVTLEVLIAIHDVCQGRAPLTAALGDTGTEQEIEAASAAFATAGATLVKVGFADLNAPDEIEARLRAAVRGVTLAAPETCGVIAVAYADAKRVGSASPHDVLAAASGVGVAGILLDTADKDGPGLRGLITDDDLREWIALSRNAGLVVAVAGKLSADDLEWLAPMGVDIVGVRGAACEAGRTSAVSAARVSMLRARCAAISRPALRLTSPSAAALV